MGESAFFILNNAHLLQKRGALDFQNTHSEKVGADETAPKRQYRMFDLVPLSCL
jgi:hypothetical protein